MNGLEHLSEDHCILLAAQYASESNVNSLRLLASSRQDVLNPDLVLRTILTFLPETTNPSHYTELVDDVIHGGLSSQTTQSTQLEADPIQSWSTAKARKRAKQLHLLPLALQSFPPSTCPEPIVQFLIHRAHRIEDQSGLLDLIPHLVDPFVDRYAFLRTWFISNVLPLLRLTFEYFPEDGPSYTLDQVERANSEEGMTIWLSYATGHCEKEDENGDVLATSKGGWQNTLSRDLKGLVGPWMYGDKQRKRRRLHGKSSLEGGSNTLDAGKPQELLSEEHHSWDQAFKRIVWMAKERLPSVAEAIGNWGGPSDVDLGGYDDDLHLSEHEGNQLRKRYAQTAFAAVYAAGAKDQETLASAQTILERIGLLMDFKPLPDLQTGLDQLPRFPSSKAEAKELPNSILEATVLLRENHTLTSPTVENFALLQFCVLSAYIFAELGSPLSVVNAAKLLFQLDTDEQLGFLQRVLHVLLGGSKRTETDWLDIRREILWLRDWGQSDRSLDINTGVFGKIDRPALEKELLKAFISASCYSAAANTYIKGNAAEHYLSLEEVEEVVISSALNQYDNASNGNRTRGGMKKASDIIAAFRGHYAKSPSFRRTEALLAATHAMSFYSLILQHNVPFQPVNIRVASDPISLIEKILAQNPGSYSDLRDLLSIGQNLITAGLNEQFSDDLSRDVLPAELESKKRKAERRIIGMAIEAALNEDDFETAYSYVVNRLDTSSAAVQANGNSSAKYADGDDIAWRAALAAGRHKSTSMSTSASTSLSTSPGLRPLEQRMELLSQALLLAPPSALPEVLNVWRKCEEEMSALRAQESQVENEFNDHADRGIPGAFVESAAPVQLRREVGRGASEEAPIGLFDVARGAAAAFSRSAFPLRGGATSATIDESPHPRPQSSAGSDAGSDGGRVRRRDMVANAVTGGLASGLGWVLGATPVQNPPPRQ